MTAAAPRAASRWRHWYRRALPAYWLFLFCVTHFPKLRFDTRIAPSDKLLHFVAFGILAFLYWRFFEALGRRAAGSFVWLAALVLSVYAALDEYLQQFVGRGTELADFLCNLAGIAIVLAVLEAQRRWRLAPGRALHEPPQTPPGSPTPR